MAVLSDLEPKRVFHYFEEICNIPHGSYKEQAISDYIVAFAKERGFTYYQDSLYNVIMMVPASKGYEEEAPIILQGHMDMVCEKTEDATIDMDNDGLELCKDDKYVFANKTTLGGDDGIAVAYMLAIAESDSIPHPALECIITVCEEVGMEGASGIDLSMLKGNKMINLDSEEEGVFLSSCAGGISTHSTLPVSYHLISGEIVWHELTISGLLGGHSGCEIHKERGNSNVIMGRVLYELNETEPICLAELEGGKKDNAIPILTNAVVGFEKSKLDKMQEKLDQIQSILSKEYSISDPDIKVICKEIKDSQYKALMIEDQKKIISLLMNLPNGVCGMSMSMPGLVETSLNLGIMRLSEKEMFMQHAIRSSVTSKKYNIVNKVKCLVEQYGGAVVCRGDYPAWEYKEQSEVRPRVIQLYEKMYGKTPVVEGIHAGLECGLLAGKIKDLDCVAMGPDILDIHTTAERLDIASTKRVYEFLLEFLKWK